MILNNNNNNIIINNNNDSSNNESTTTTTRVVERIIPLPSVLIDFMAMTLCDLIPPRKISAKDRRRQSLPNMSNVKNKDATQIMPELVYFIQKITFQAGINCRTALVALIYLNRAKQLLPKGAVGGHDTCHRMFLASILLASKFLRSEEKVNDTVVVSTIPSTWSHYYSYHHYQFHSLGPLTNKKLSNICGGGLFPLDEINQLERAFLKLIQYQCWVDDHDVQKFVLKHRVDFSL